MLRSHQSKYFNIFFSFLFSSFCAPLCLSIFLYCLIFPLLSSSQFFSLFLLKFFSTVWGSLLFQCGYGCGCGGSSASWSCRGCGGSSALWVMPWGWVIEFVGVVGGSCHGVCGFWLIWCCQVCVGDGGGGIAVSVWRQWRTEKKIINIWIFIIVNLIFYCDIYVILFHWKLKENHWCWVFCKVGI